MKKGFNLLLTRGAPVKFRRCRAMSFIGGADCLQTNMSIQKLVELCSPDKLSSHLYHQKQNGRFCDVQLLFCNSRFPAHGCVISSSSSYANRVLQSRENTVMGPKVDIAVPLNLPGNVFKENEFCQDCAERVIDFMYFRRILVEEDHMPHIYSLGEALEIPELLKLCKPFVRENKILSDDCQNSTAENFALPLDEPTKNDAFANCKDKCKIDCDDKDVILGTPTSQMSCQDLGWMNLDSDRLTCPKCKDTFTNVFMFQQHCNTHLGKFYTCYVCKYTTLKIPNLLQHLKLANHRETVCSLCLHETETNIILKKHLNEHDHTQPFFCRTCMTRFQTRAALNSHIVKHSTETPFICSVCGRGFKWKQGLQNHMNIHTSIKNHLCDQCGYSTAHLKSFQDHKITHSGKKFECPVSACQFTSVRKESLKHHLLTHSKEKPYQCEICGQAFSQAKNLRRHAATHDPSADAVQCPICSFKTMRSDKLKDHFRRQHKNNENDLPKKSRKRKSGTATWSQCGDKTPKTTQNAMQEINPSEKIVKRVKFSKSVKFDKGFTPEVHMAIIPESSSENGNKEVSCQQIFSFMLDKEVTLTNSSIDLNSMLLTIPEGEILTLSQEQTNLLVCNSEGTSTMPIDLDCISLENVQSIDSGSLVGNLPIDQINKPLLFQLQSEDTVGSEVEIPCLSTESVLTISDKTKLDKFANGSDNLNETAEKIVIDQSTIDSMPIVLLSCPEDNVETCLPFAYTNPDLQNPLESTETCVLLN